MKYLPQYGDRRKVTKFLWFPIYECDKWYWLKTVTLTEEYTKDCITLVSNYTDEIEGYMDGWFVVEVSA